MIFWIMIIVNVECGLLERLFCWLICGFGICELVEELMGIRIWRFHFYELISGY
jgi:hypothetical protein